MQCSAINGSICLSVDGMWLREVLTRVWPFCIISYSSVFVFGFYVGCSFTDYL